MLRAFTVGELPPAQLRDALRAAVPTPARARQIREAIAERKAKNRTTRWNPPPRGVPKDVLPAWWPSVQYVVGQRVAGLSEEDRTIVYAVIGRHVGVSMAALGRFLGGLTVQQVWQASIKATRKKNRHLVPTIERIRGELPT